MHSFLLLVDIDGTLLNVKRSVTQSVWSYAWKDVFGQDVPWYRLDSAAGKTDLQILAQLLADRQQAQQVAPRFFSVLASYAQQVITPDAVSLCPGVHMFLETAQKLNALLVVLTGNEERCGWHKLRVAGLQHFFRHGVFGCQSIERSALPPYALHWALQRRLWNPLRSAVVVGDTPNDIACAKAHSLISMAVATGPYTPAQLATHEPTFCFKTLEEAAVSLHWLCRKRGDMKPRLIIAIDGPAGSGKTTTARLLAERLGYTYVDTGAMYRALTLAALEQNIPLTDQALAELLDRISIEVRSADGEQHTYLNGRDVTERIRQNDVTTAVSQVSSFPSVRAAMLRLQRELGKQGGIVMDGRDIGTAVFPDADVKVFLIADLQRRAERRFEELRQNNPTLTLHSVMEQLRQRDMLDSSRECNPLRRAPDAVIIDTTNLTIEQQVEAIVRLVERRLQANVSLQIPSDGSDN